jgi:hypothetical protein
MLKLAKNWASLLGEPDRSLLILPHTTSFLLFMVKLDNEYLWVEVEVSPQTVRAFNPI